MRRRHKPPHERREHMAVFRIVVVVGSVEVARHQAHRVPAVLFTQVQTEFVAGDLRQGVPLVGRFQRSGEKILFFDRLRSTARIDAARSQKTELLHSMQVALHDHVVLDLEVLKQEFRAVRLIRHDSADLRSGQNHVVRLFGIEKLLHRKLIAQIQFRMGPFEDIRVSLFFKFPHAGAADHPTMAADENLCVLLNHFQNPVS